MEICKLISYRKQQINVKEDVSAKKLEIHENEQTHVGFGLRGMN